ncbi:MAG: hypothetical protein NW220_18695 [Leptolyngbyaceae cyanobacterium bins.349]|nr:hypothetical protein [Leptolyngbyaceae cyanobacterium bins.349]
MMRFAVLFLLTLGLLLSCRQAHSSQQISEWTTQAAAATLSVQSVPTTDPFIWWEAEIPNATNFPPSDRHPFVPANATEAAILSDGKWIGVDDRQRSERLFLEYQVQVATGGQYFFYTRKFWQHGPFQWRWDDQPWQTVGSQVYLMDSAPMRQFVVANWVSLGRVNLAAGTHRLRIELTQNQGPAAFDCFVLTRSPLQPQGKLQPNQRYTANIPDGFLFHPGSDPLLNSPIDLRYLNEPEAGRNGWLRVKGEEFVQGTTGKPVKFWAVNVGESALWMNRAERQSMARFLAKQGVNMVRVHAPLWAEDLKTVSPQKLDGLFGLVADLKQQGIYTTLSIYFPVWRNLTASDGFAGYQNQAPFALLFFNPDFQQIYNGWWKTILTTPNPYTGKALRDDPAVAAVELVNEDSYFFWTFNPYETIPAPQMAQLERQFGDWLNRKYGSMKAALTAWANPPAIRGDDLAAGRVGIMALSELVGQRESRRAQDTAAFLAASQQTFFERAIAHLRTTLNYQGLIYASNWITANSQILGPLDKYTNTVADFMDRHGYVVGPHEGAAASYSLNPGETYEDRPALRFKSFQPEQEFDFDLPIMDVRYNGKPSTITEINWAMPNRFRADFPLLAAAYGSLQGTDGFFFFALDTPRWQATLTKFAIASPVIMGQFPATALMYRTGMIAPGKPVMDISLNTQDVFNLQGAPLSAPQNLDEFRAQDVPAGQTLSSDRAPSLDPLAFLVGKVNVRFANRATTQQVNLSRLINRQTKTVRSNTGQLLWDYNTGLVTVNAPQAQGATGFLRQAGELAFDTLKLRSPMDYGTILLVALDNQPLKTSRRMLLQVMSEEQTLGWQTAGTPRKTIQSIGNFAIAVRHLSGTLSLQRPDARALQVTALDANGYPVAKLGNGAEIKLQPETFYYLLEQAAR